MRSRFYLIAFGLLLAALGSAAMLVATGFSNGWMLATFWAVLGMVVSFALAVSSP